MGAQVRIMSNIFNYSGNLSLKCISLFPNVVSRLYCQCMNGFKRTSVSSVYHLISSPAQKRTYRFIMTSESDDEEPTHPHEDFTEPWIPKSVYLNSSDSLTKELAHANSVQCVFDIIDKNKEVLNSENICQALITLWYHQKVYYKTHQLGFLDLNWNYGEMHSQEILKDYCDKRNSHPTFTALIDSISEKYSEMDSISLACIFLFLSRMGFNARKGIMNQLFYSLKCRMSEESLPLAALSRLSVALKPYKELWSYISCIDILHQAVNKMDEIKSLQEFHLVTIIMKGCVEVMSFENFQKYKQLLDTLYENGLLAEASPNTLIKLLSFLSGLPGRNNQYNNVELIQKVLLLLAAQEEALRLNQIIYMLKVTQVSMIEPPEVMDLVKKSCAECVKIFREESEKISPPLLSSLMTQLPFVKQHKLVGIIEEYVTKQMPRSCFGAFDLLPQLKICSKGVVNTFWANALVAVKQQAHTVIFVQCLLDLCERYILFMSSIGNSHRNRTFEKELASLVTNELLTGISALEPSKFAIFASFILSYGLTGKYKELPDFIYEKLKDMFGQFQPSDCIFLSRALNLFKNNRMRPSDLFFEQYVNLTTALNSRFIEYLDHPGEVSLNDVNIIFRAFVNLKGPRDNKLFSLIVERLDHVKSEEISSRSIRNTVYNLMGTSHSMPHLIDQMVEYCCQNKQYLTRDTLGKLLHACYFFGYKPKRGDEFINIVAESVVRNLDNFNGLNLLQVALSLSYFYTLPVSLTQHIFSVAFLETLDEEIKDCYMKTSYPTRVRFHLMQLNRAVCLDNLEADVPWFHEKYCEQLIALRPQVPSPFNCDVYSKLCAVTGHEDYVKKNAVAHYGYLIDFLVCLDGFSRPLKVFEVKEKKESDRVERIAIILHVEEEFSGGEGQLAPGALELKHRHLEILGYKVVVITTTLWNSLFISNMTAKLQFLRNALGIKSEPKSLVE